MIAARLVRREVGELGQRISGRGGTVSVTGPAEGPTHERPFATTVGRDS
jgi:hypothetical protein